MSLISVVTTFYNSEKTLPQAMQSLQCQSYSNYEHILVNDGSEDNSTDLIKKIDDERIKLIDKGRVGRAKALNIGLECATGDYIAILDSDDMSLPNRFEQQKKMLDNDSTLSLVCSNAELINEQGLRTGVTNFPVSHEELVNSLEKLNPFPHSSVMYRRDLALKVGGYNFRCEKSLDYNFYLDFLIAGGRMLGHAVPLISLRSYPTSWGKNDTQGLQIRYGIMGLINYFYVLHGGKSFMRGTPAEWVDIKHNFDAWFDENNYQTRMDAKRILAKIRYSIKTNVWSDILSNIVKVLKKDPWFWRYKGSGFNYPEDAKMFLKYIHVKAHEFDNV